MASTLLSGFTPDPARGFALLVRSAVGATLLFGLATLIADEARSASEHDEAETPARTTNPIDELVVTATRRATPRGELAASVSVLDGETIELEQTRDVLELLRDVPGFSIVQTGSRGGTTALFVRGGESNHNLVLVDGVQVNGGGGEFDFSNLSADGIERIEVVRGPAAALYGSDAVASVIHVITARGAGPTRTSFRALAGSDRTHEVAASLSGSTERVGYALNVGRYATDGTISLNNDAENSSFRGRLDFSVSDDLDIGLSSSFTASRFDFPTDFVMGVPGGFPAVDPDQGRKSFEWYNSLNATYAHDVFTHRLTIGWVRNRFDDFDGLDSIPSDFSDSKTRTREVRKAVDYSVSFEGPALGSIRSDALLGLEYERQNFTRSDRRDATRTASAEDRRNRAVFAQIGLSLDSLFLTASARLDTQSEQGTTFTPAVSLAYVLPGGQTKLRASLARGFKEPTFRESFGSSATVVGNEGLRPETSRSFEIAVERTALAGALQVSAAYFRLDFEDLIAFVGRIGPGRGTSFENVQESRSQGLEVELRYDLSDSIRVGASYTRLRTRVLDGGRVGGTGFQPGEDLLRRPVHSGSFYATFSGEDWNVRTSGTVVGPRIDRDFGFDSSGVRVRNPDYVKVDVAARYRFVRSAGGSELWLLLRAENVLDDEYDEAFGFEAPGRRVLVGLEVRS